MKYFFFLFFAFFFFYACKDCPVDPVVEQEPEAPGQIKLQHMEVGQKNIYLRLEGSNYWSSWEEQEYTYTQDSLFVEVAARDGDRFLWKETPSANAMEQDSFEYWVSIRDDSLLIDASESTQFHSALWYSFYLGQHFSEEKKMRIPLQPFDAVQCNVIGWKTDLDYSESYIEAYDTDLTLFGIDHGRVNVIVDNVAMQVDGPGKTYVYNRDQIIRTSTYSWWTGTGQGYDLVPN